MKNRIRRGRDFWQQAIGQHKSSGLTIAAWCQQQQLVLSTFSRWKQRLASPPVDLRASTSTPVVAEKNSLVEVTPVLPNAQTTTPANPSLIEISLPNGTQLRFRDDVAQSTLQQLIALSSTGGQS